MSDVTGIINWRQLSEEITTSGQPTEEQLVQLRDLGVENIINLGPHHNTGALEDEASSVTKLGMDYIYIPVEFDNPTEEDFQAFVAALKRTTGTKSHVHCIYNARVSAFFYRLSKHSNDWNDKGMFSTMDSIWRPGGVWAKFIGDENSFSQPNRYLGYDY